MFSCYPCRLKHTYIVNASSFVVNTVQLFLSWMKPAMRQRVTFVSPDFREVKSLFEPKHLPDSLGGSLHGKDWWDEWVSKQLDRESRTGSAAWHAGGAAVHRLSAPSNGSGGGGHDGVGTGSGGTSGESGGAEATASADHPPQPHCAMREPRGTRSGRSGNHSKSPPSGGRSPSDSPCLTNEAGPHHKPRQRRRRSQSTRPPASGSKSPSPLPSPVSSPSQGAQTRSSSPIASLPPLPTFL